MIKIINLSDFWPGEAPREAIYVGRAMPRQRLRGSPLGNPHKIDPKQGVTRDICIQAFAADLAAAIARVEEYRAGGKRRPTLRQERAVAELDRLTLLYLLDRREMTLACWCHPQSCHANTIATHIEDAAHEITVRFTADWPSTRRSGPPHLQPASEQ